MFTDKDYVKAAGATTWKEIPGTGPYQVVLDIVGDAVFFDAASTKKTRTIDGAEARNIDIFIKGDAFAAGAATSITVKATLKDNAPAPTLPDTGSVKDDDFPYTWTLINQTGAAPTSMKQLDTQDWRNNFPEAALYAYQMLPDKPDVAEYEGQLVSETFGPITARFNLGDLKLDDPWFTQHPDVDKNNVDEIARALFDSGTIGSFVIDHNDQIHDRHSGFGKPNDKSFLQLFTDKAFASDTGVGFHLPQSYSVCNTIIGNYIITRALNIDKDKNAQLFVMKTGP